MYMFMHEMYVYSIFNQVPALYDAGDLFKYYWEIDE